MRKRRMPDEKIAEIVKSVDFSKEIYTWMTQLESCFHRILKYEYYLNSIPDNMALPKYRKIIIRIIYRMLNQVPKNNLKFSNNIYNPDPIIKKILEYFIEAEFERKRQMIERSPITNKGIRLVLDQLAREFEI